MHFISVQIQFSMVDVVYGMDIYVLHGKRSSLTNVKCVEIFGKEINEFVKK
jgi:hypothetical protein